MDLEKRRMKNYNKLDLSCKPKLNVLEIDYCNSIQHEMAKMIAYYLLKKGVLPEMLPEYFLKKEWWNPHNAYMFSVMHGCTFRKPYHRPFLVTEARLKSGRRIDIFFLDSVEGTFIEIETDRNVTKPDSITIRI
jgi:hypothetical protein